MNFVILKAGRLCREAAETRVSVASHGCAGPNSCSSELGWEFYRGDLPRPATAVGLGQLGCGGFSSAKAVPREAQTRWRPERTRNRDKSLTVRACRGTKKIQAREHAPRVPPANTRLVLARKRAKIVPTAQRQQPVLLLQRSVSVRCLAPATC